MFLMENWQRKSGIEKTRIDDEGSVPQGFRPGLSCAAAARLESRRVQGVRVSSIEI